MLLQMMGEACARPGIGVRQAMFWPESMLNSVGRVAGWEGRPEAVGPRNWGQLWANDGDREMKMKMTGSNRFMILTFYHGGTENTEKKISRKETKGTKAGASKEESIFSRSCEEFSFVGVQMGLLLDRELGLFLKVESQASEQRHRRCLKEEGLRDEK